MGLNVYVPFDPATPLLGVQIHNRHAQICVAPAKKHKKTCIQMYTNAHVSIFHMSGITPKWKQPFVSVRTCKETVVHSCNGTLHNNENKPPSSKQMNVTNKML